MFAMDEKSTGANKEHQEEQKRLLIATTIR